MKSTEAKVVILGGQGVGKTSIVMCYLGNAFNKHISPTIGASFFSCRLNVNNQTVKLQIWDTAGQERFRAMAPMYYRNAGAAFLVYDVTSQDSFNTMKTWVSELRRNVDEVVVMCVIGNKTDLTRERMVCTEEAQAYSNSIGALYFETSAVNNEGIEEAFLNTTMLILQNAEKQPLSQEEEAEENLKEVPGKTSIRLHSEQSDDRPWVCC